MSSDKTICLREPWSWLLPILFYVACAVLALYLLRRFIEGPFYTKKNRIDGKVVIVTGCNTGIGKEIALEMARRGGRIYMACRDAVRCEAARLEIIERSQNPNIFNRTLDLGSLESVRQFVVNFKSEEPRLDILVNNAGVMAIPRKLTPEGLEYQMGVNHFGHFLLTNLLLDPLKAAAPSRIVVISSFMHLFGRIYKDDLHGEKRYSKLIFGAYSNTKLANILFTRKLAELLEGTGVTANSCNPGLVRTELARYNELPKWLWAMIYAVMRFAFKSPRAGAQTPLRLALDPGLAKSTGGYYSEYVKFPLPPWASDKQMADWLWRESEKLTGLRPQDGIETISVN